MVSDQPPSNPLNHVGAGVGGIVVVVVVVVVGGGVVGNNCSCSYL